MDLQEIERLVGLNLLQIGGVIAFIVFTQLSSMVASGSFSRERWYKINKLKSKEKSNTLSPEGRLDLIKDKQRRMLTVIPALVLVASLPWSKEYVAYISLSMWYCYPLLLIAILILFKIIRMFYGIIKIMLLRRAYNKQRQHRPSGWTR